MFSHPDYDGHEALLFAQDTASGLRALIAIHDTTLGPAFGGCRMYPYASEQHAMTDVVAEGIARVLAGAGGGAVSYEFAEHRT
jgi:glutamate dehydrogenase/leucine dehydrogenase